MLDGMGWDGPELGALETAWITGALDENAGVTTYPGPRTLQGMQAEFECFTSSQIVIIRQIWQALSSCEQRNLFIPHRGILVPGAVLGTW